MEVVVYMIVVCLCLVVRLIMVLVSWNICIVWLLVM